MLHTNETVKILIEAGAAVNMTDMYEKTPLHMAAKDGHYETMKILLEAGADVSVMDKEGRTALHRAAWNRHDKTVEMLLYYGAEPNTGDLHDYNITRLEFDIEKIN